MAVGSNGSDCVWGLGGKLPPKVARHKGGGLKRDMKIDVLG